MIDPKHVANALLAGAAGDCIGAPLEGKPAAETVRLPQRWRMTDDTILTLATCRAIGAAGRVDPETIAAAMVDAFRARSIPGLGASTLKALNDLAAGGHWALSGRSGEHAAGNGAAMRIFPLALMLDGSTKQDRVLIRDVSRITHKDDEAYAGALAVVLAAHAIQQPIPAASILSSLVTELPDTRVRDTLDSLAHLPADADGLAAAAVSGVSAYVAESVPLAIFLAVTNRNNVEAAVLGAVRCGGDTDTIASIAGQLVGSTGATVSKQWREALPCHDEIVTLADELQRLMG